MNRFEKRKLKTNLYKHGNTIMYITIFVMASVITIAAAMNRTDDVMYVDETKIAEVPRESVEIKNSSTNKVSSMETNTKAVTEQKTTQTQTTQSQTKEPQTTEPRRSQTTDTKIRVTADTLKVRAEASQDSEMLGMVDMDSVFDVISQKGEWIEINYNGNRGYINSEFTEFTED